MATVSILEDGSIQLPDEIRRRLGLKVGDQIHVLTVGRQIALIPVADDPIAAGRGMFKGGKAMSDLLDEKRRELEEEERDLPPPGTHP